MRMPMGMGMGMGTGWIGMTTSLCPSPSVQIPKSSEYGRDRIPLMELTYHKQAAAWNAGWRFISHLCVLSLIVVKTYLYITYVRLLAVLLSYDSIGEI